MSKAPPSRNQKRGQDQDDRETKRGRMNDKVFNDSIHGHMYFPSLIVQIINTPEFDRLRHLKQLGLGYRVYPSAGHNRFEHSLGTCFLAGKMVESLEKHYKGTAKLFTKSEKLCVQIAALCHDLGHGPFSHTWEVFLKRKGIPWRHEDASIEIFDRLLEKKEGGLSKLFSEAGIKAKERDLIRDMISGQAKEGTDRHYLYQIVNNKDNDIDVDKWDYILRDKSLLNVPVTFDHLRLLEFSQVLEVTRGDTKRKEICFRNKGVHIIYDMLLTRASLHERAYQHRVVRTLELMLLDAFSAAVEYGDPLKLMDASTDNILKLTDFVYYEIKHSTDSKLKDAQELIRRIESRLLYHRVLEITLDECERGILDKYAKYTDEKINSIIEENIDSIIERKIGDSVFEILRSKVPSIERKDIATITVNITLGSQYPIDSEGNALPVDVFIFNKDDCSVAHKLKHHNHLLKASLSKKTIKKKYLVLYKKLNEIETMDYSTVKDEIKQFIRHLQFVDNIKIEPEVILNEN